MLFAPVAGWLPQFLGRRQTCLLFCLAYSVLLHYQAVPRLFHAHARTCFRRPVHLFANHRVLRPGMCTGHIDAMTFPKNGFLLPSVKSQIGSRTGGRCRGWWRTCSPNGLGWGPLLLRFSLRYPALLPAPGLCSPEWGQEDRQEGASGDKNGPLPNPLNAPKMQMSTWARFWRSCLDGLRCLLSGPSRYAFGRRSGTFLKACSIFLSFLDSCTGPTPARHRNRVSSLMAASMAGSTLFRLPQSAPYRLQPGHLLCLAVLLAFFSFFMLMFSTVPGQPRPRESLLAFLLLELACGLYFPAVSFFSKAEGFP